MDYLFKKLTECIKQYNKVVIMTHKHPDLDGIASALCLHEIIKNLKKECYIILSTEKLNISLTKGINLLNENNISINFVKPKQAKKLIASDNLLIILDTTKKELVESTEMLNMKNIFVVDHHMNTSTIIENTIANYIDSNKSSIVEIMVKYLKYLNMKVEKTILTLMLAGLEIDTHSYRLKTSEETFNCASYLIKNGASAQIKNEILKVSKKVFLTNQKHIKDSYFIKEGFIICDMKKVENVTDLALVADDLLKFDNVQASFTIGMTNDKIVHISARSMGKINVQNIMGALGGGGHITDAACQFKNKTNKEVIELIKKIVTEV